MYIAEQTSLLRLKAEFLNNLYVLIIDFSMTKLISINKFKGFQRRIRWKISSLIFQCIFLFRISCVINRKRPQPCVNLILSCIRLLIKFYQTKTSIWGVYLCVTVNLEIIASYHTLLNIRALISSSRDGKKYRTAIWPQNSRK